MLEISENHNRMMTVVNLIVSIGDSETIPVRKVQTYVWLKIAVKPTHVIFLRPLNTVFRIC